MVGGSYRPEDEETTDFGAPKGHDGNLMCENLIFMPSLDEVQTEFWLEMFMSADLNWAVVGLSKSSGEPGGPRRG